MKVYEAYRKYAAIIMSRPCSEKEHKNWLLAARLNGWHEKCKNIPEVKLP